MYINSHETNHTTYSNLYIEHSEYENSEFEEYLGEDIHQLENKDLLKLKLLYGQILKYEDDNNFDAADKLWREFNNTLRIAGVAIVYQDFEDFLETIKPKLNKENYIQINTLYKEIETSTEYLDTSHVTDINLVEEKNKKIWEQIKYILKPLGYDLDEILNQIENEDIIIALYNVHDGNEIKYKPFNQHTIEDLSKEDIQKHKIIWERVKKILPQNCLKKIVSFAISTDGKAGEIAHIISLDQNNEKFRLAIDIKDSFAKDGTLAKELDKTIIHELGHILTLNDSQVTKNSLYNEFTYITDKGITKQNSYLNQFYNEFWENIYKEWEKADISQIDESGEDGLIKFYDNHIDEFVSEYASTNPEEDIAESFMSFIVEDKPVENNIATQKVLFFYRFKELLNLRKEIRSNLNNI